MNTCEASSDRLNCPTPTDHSDLQRASGCLSPRSFARLDPPRLFARPRKGDYTQFVIGTLTDRIPDNTALPGPPRCFRDFLLQRGTGPVCAHNLNLFQPSYLRGRMIMAFIVLDPKEPSFGSKLQRAILVRSPLYSIFTASDFPGHCPDPFLAVTRLVNLFRLAPTPVDSVRISSLFESASKAVYGGSPSDNPVCRLGNCACLKYPGPGVESAEILAGAMSTKEPSLAVDFVPVLQIVTPCLIAKACCNYVSWFDGVSG
jgi:hypothetical protein